VHAIGGDDDGRGEAAAVARRQRHDVAIFARLHDVGAGHELRARLLRERHEQRVELDAPDHQRRRAVRFHDGRLAVRALEIQARNGVRRNAMELSFEIREAAQRSHADAAAARFVAREDRSIEEPHGDARESERAGGSRAGRSGAYDEHRRLGRNSGDHRKISIKISARRAKAAIIS